MIYIGMIFQYDQNSGSGLIMLSDGEKKEFSAAEWIDTQNTPAVAQKIAYVISGSNVQVRVATEEDIVTAASDQEPDVIEEEPTPEEDAVTFDTIDEYIEYYTQMGFKLIKDTGDNESRNAALRFYVAGDFGEVTLKQNGSKINVTQMMNGQVVFSS